MQRGFLFGPVALCVHRVLALGNGRQRYSQRVHHPAQRHVARVGSRREHAVKVRARQTGLLGNGSDTPRSGVMKLDA